MSLTESIPDVTLVAPYPRVGTRHGGTSGVASYTANLAHALADLGTRVTVVSTYDDGAPERELDGAVTVQRVFRPGARALPTAFDAARQTRAPVIHLQHELFLYGGGNALPGLLGSLGAIRLPGNGRPKSVVTMHQVVDPRQVDRSFTRLHRIRLPAPAARLAVTGVQRSIDALADRVIVHEPRFSAQLSRAVQLPHGIEPAADLERGQARAALGIDPDEFIALCFGFLAPYKGIEQAGDAARLAGPGVRLVVAGGPHPRLKDRHNYAAALRRAYGGHARFTGFVTDLDVVRWFRAADVVLLPYPAPHASSGALALALAYGVPVLASTALVETCGLPAAAGYDSTEELAGRLVALLGDMAERRALAEALSPVAEGRSWPAVARQHQRLYDEVRSRLR
ncbi:MAG TPA: glycosyltransferase [Mycobacteriales bacterium]|nr:glycosyltransferase [Mycobacteriales bacterium]